MVKAVSSLSEEKVNYEKGYGFRNVLGAIGEKEARTAG